MQYDFSKNPQLSVTESKNTKMFEMLDKKCKNVV
jgi:hypothetical protein